MANSYYQLVDLFNLEVNPIIFSGTNLLPLSNSTGITESTTMVITPFLTSDVVNYSTVTA